MSGPTNGLGGLAQPKTGVGDADPWREWQTAYQARSGTHSRLLFQLKPFFRSAFSLLLCFCSAFALTQSPGDGK
jgi:hypothetical protein